jgi:hypothetical protein
MATEQQHSIRAGTPIDDYDAIAATVQLYIDGSAQGDSAKLSEGFTRMPRCTAQSVTIATTSRSRNTSSS